MPASKIVNADEVDRWIKEGRTYQWMSDTYLSKYDIQIRPSAFSNRRSRHGMDGRLTRNAELLPWTVRPEHRWHLVARGLRAEAKRREGKPLSEQDARFLQQLMADLEANNAVVHYEPRLPDGFVLVPRTANDTDIVRAPKVRRKG